MYINYVNRNFTILLLFITIIFSFYYFNIPFQISLFLYNVTSKRFCKKMKKIIYMYVDMLNEIQSKYTMFYMVEKDLVNNPKLELNMLITDIDIGKVSSEYMEIDFIKKIKSNLSELNNIAGIILKAEESEDYSILYSNSFHTRLNNFEYSMSELVKESDKFNSDVCTKLINYIHEEKRGC